MKPIRVLVVDDSALLRRLIVDSLSKEPDLEIVGQAKDGEDAVNQIISLQPDVVTLDVEMPRMSGLDALKKIMETRPTRVIMVSSLTASGTTTTIQALESGAVDFVAKPSGGSFGVMESLHGELLTKIRAAMHANLTPTVQKRIRVAKLNTTSDRVLLIASSTGGPRALTTLFESLPKGLTVPVLVVQHMPVGFVEGLAKRLDRIGTIPCDVAKPGDCVTSGQALLAPAGQHLVIQPGGTLEFTNEPQLHGVRPAADFLFKSAAKVYGSRCIGAVLTGMGRDGAEGALAIQKAGGLVLSESEETCTIYGMPKSAMALGAVYREVPIYDMAHSLAELLDRRLANAS